MFYEVKKVPRYSDMLIYLRKRKGLSQQELATELKMSRSAISMYETGKREPDLETFEIFADFYNVDMNTLTGSQNTMSFPANITPMPATISRSRLGTIACGEPILADQNKVSAPSDLSEEAVEIGRAYDRATPKDRSTVRAALADQLQAPMKVAAKGGVTLNACDVDSITFQGGEGELPR